jgi:hypothetical protein
MATRQSKRTIKPSVRLQPLDEVPMAGASTGTPKGKKADENEDVDMDDQEEAEGEEEEDDDPNRLYCTCRQPEKGQMIECDACKDWYVVSRAGLAHSDLKPRMRGGSDRSNWAAIGKLILWGNSFACDG